MTVLSGVSGRRKYELAIYALALVFILGLFRILANDVLAGVIKFIFGAVILGNVGSKVAGVFTPKTEEE